MSLHPGTDRYNPAGNSDFTRKAEALEMHVIGTRRGTIHARDHVQAHIWRAIAGIATGDEGGCLIRRYFDGVERRRYQLGELGHRAALLRT